MKDKILKWIIRIRDKAFGLNKINFQFEERLIIRVRELKALEILKPYFPKGFLFETDYSLPFQLIQHICNDILIYKPKTIIEFGSGLSTIIISNFLKENNLDVEFISVDEDENWQSLISKHSNSVSFFSFGISENNPFSKNGGGEWYNIPKNSDLLIKSYDLVIIDGPIGKNNKFARYGALNFIKNKLNESSIIFIDDVNRYDEQILARDLARDFNLNKVEIYKYSRLSHNYKIITSYVIVFFDMEYHCPKVSLIVPTFQRSILISETIDSIINQDFEDWECIIVDDNSTDNTSEVIMKYISIDKRIKFYIRPNNIPKGSNSCRNLGLNFSNGKYVKWIDSDDLILPNTLNLQVSVLEENLDLKVCLAYGRFFNHFTKELEEYWSKKTDSQDLLLDYLLQKIKWPIGGPLWRRDFFDIEPFNLEIKNGQEWLFHGLSIMKLKNYQIYNFQKSIYLARRGHENISGKINSDYYYNRAKSRWIFLKIGVLENKLNFKLAKIISIEIIKYLAISFKLRIKKFYEL
jgi:glycosyltransferase involved in cell wall biosynthesis